VASTGGKVVFQRVLLFSKQKNVLLMLYASCYCEWSYFDATKGQIFRVGPPGL